MKLALHTRPGPEPVTRLSRRRPSALGFRAILQLAWPSLLGISAMLASSSCIVAEPPEYREAVRTRPFLDVTKAVPPTQRVLPAYTDGLVAIPLNVPVRSEDAGEGLQFVYFLDYGVSSSESVPAGESLIIAKGLPASTYDDTSRAAEHMWVPRTKTTKGCHLLTLIIAHASSFRDEDKNHLKTVEAGSDAAMVNWWVNVDPEPEELNTLENCPVSMQSGL